MAVWPPRTVRVVLCGALLAALVVGALSVGSLPIGVVDADVSGDSIERVDEAGAKTPVRQAPGDGDTRRWLQTNETQPQMLEGFDRVVTTFDVAENGSASVTVLYRYILTDNESRQEWEQLRSDIEERPGAYVAAEEARWNQTVADARNTTDRNMTVSGFDVRTDEGTTPREYGDVVFTFQWSSFARVEPKWIGAGDALQGYALEDGTTLRISWPESYSLQSAAPEPDDADREDVVGWRGEETDFLENEPWIEVLQEGNTSGPQPPDESFDLVTSILVGGLVLLTLGSAAVWWFRMADDVDESGGPTDPGPSPTVQPPPELLSNEERVLTLLEANGGRMKQQTIVTELGWTEAKTSQVVGELREEGSIEVFRLGRENVLAFPDRVEEPNGPDRIDDDSSQG